MFLYSLVIAGLAFPFLLMKQGGSSLWVGCLLLGGEALLSIWVGRKLLRILRARTKMPESLLGVPLLFTFFAIYLAGNLLALLAMTLTLPDVSH